MTHLLLESSGLLCYTTRREAIKKFPQLLRSTMRDGKSLKRIYIKTKQINGLCPHLHKSALWIYKINVKFSEVSRLMPIEDLEKPFKCWAGRHRSKKYLNVKKNTLSTCRKNFLWKLDPTISC